MKKQSGYQFHNATHRAAVKERNRRGESGHAGQGEEPVDHEAARGHVV